MQKKHKVERKYKGKEREERRKKRKETSDTGES